MTKWAVVTVALYVALLVGLTAPLVFVSFLDFPKPVEGQAQPAFTDVIIRHLHESFEAYRTWQYWAMIAVLGLAQAALLVVPVRARADIVLKKRHILTPLLTASLFAGLLFGTGLMSIIVAIFGDNTDEAASWAVLAVLVAGWVAWFFIFRRFTRAAAPTDWMNRITAYLLRMSIAELLIAVSCHIVVRRRGDCSAPLGTFLGICAGLAVLLASFGPGVFYLFAARAATMQSKKSLESDAAGAGRQP
jgi:MFS family permease